MIRVERFIPMIDEMEEFYSTLDTQQEMLCAALEEMFEIHKEDSPFVQKTEQIRILAEKSEVTVLRHFPFWHQFSAGRNRRSWGGFNAAGQFVYNKNGGALAETYGKALQEDRDKGFLHNWNNPVGMDHHALNYDDILQLGLSGLRGNVQKYRAECTDPAKLPFYAAAEETLNLLGNLSVRFAEKAEEMLKTETEPAVRENLERIAKAARRVPEYPAETFYEALASIVFCRECIGSLEGIGVSTYGHLDRLLWPYYQRDVANGTLTEQQAIDLFEMLFLYTGIRFEEDENPAETSTTVILGGCNADGDTVYNDVTRLILQAELECRVANVKFDARISQEHPDEYIEWLCKLQLSELPVLVFMNDETHIAGRVKYGQDIRDVRGYVAGGCHETVLGGTEVCTRADTWISLPGLLLATLKKKEYATFEELYTEAIADIHAYHEKIVAMKNAFECHWVDYAPMPLYSTMMRDCVEKGVDVTAGGSRYASTALSMVAPATFVDSLYSLKTLCYDEKRMSVQELLNVLERDYKGDDLLRQYIIDRIPKYCSGNETLDVFTQKVFHDLSQVSGQTNGRGGKYYPAFYPHEIYRPLGQKLMATPDGRKKGFSLSRGASPSEFLTGITPTDMLRSAEKIDFTEFTDSFALEVTLPILNAEIGMKVLPGLVKAFLLAKGSTLQFNMLDVQRLRDAQIHPEQHRDLLVRVCGYSYYFVNLSKETQEEVISRAIRAV